MKTLAALACILGILMTTNTLRSETMDSLTQREKSIAAVAAYSAMGDIQKLKQSLAEGLDCGVTVAEFKEILVQTYAYCGFPRSLNALNAYMELLKERGGKDVEGASPSPLPGGKSVDFGAENQTKLVGAPVKGELFEFAPAIDEFLKAHLFGDIFARDNLDWRTREIATIAMLASMDGVESQLKSHIKIGLNNGVSDKQVSEILVIASDAKGMSNTSSTADVRRIAISSGLKITDFSFFWIRVPSQKARMLKAIPKNGEAKASLILLIFPLLSSRPADASPAGRCKQWPRRSLPS